MDKIKTAWTYITTFTGYLAKPLEWLADLVKAYPKGTLIVVVVLVVVVRVL